MSKLLTISIAAYNVEKYLIHAVTSCMLDELRDYLDIIIVDDGSRDRTQMLAKELAMKYPDCIRCFSKENGGYGSTINYSLKYAQGKYFKLLDADDWYNGNNLITLVERLKTCNSDLILTDYTEVYEKSEKANLISYHNIQNNQEMLFDEVCDKLILSMHATMYKTELLRKINMHILEHCFYTDVLYMLTPIPYVETFTYFNIDIYQYRLSVEGQSVSIEGIRRHYADGKKVLDALLPIVNMVNKTSRKYAYLVRQIAISADFQLRAYLCLPASKQNKQRIIDLDRELKCKQIDVYYQMNNKKTKLLRLSNYRLYYLYSKYFTYQAKHC